MNTAAPLSSAHKIVSFTPCCCFISGNFHLLYEAVPLSFIVEQAGGISSTGSQRVMDVHVSYNIFILCAYLRHALTNLLHVCVSPPHLISFMIHAKEFPYSSDLLGMSVNS